MDDQSTNKTGKTRNFEFNETKSNEAEVANGC